MIKVPIKKLKKDAIIPTKGSCESAGYDLYACLDRAIEVLPGQTVQVPTGLSIQLPVGYVGLIYARSGLATKRGLAPANKVGVCDSDYRGEYIVALHNHGQHKETIQPQERIAQLVITPYLSVAFEETDSLDETERGDGGFGSTGR